MHRVTLEEVKAAAEALKSKGVYPSTAAVREYIGHGSLTTVNKYLQDVRSLHPAWFSSALKNPPLLPPELQSKGLQLIQETLRIAEQTVSNSTLEQAQRDVSSLENEMEKLKLEQAHLLGQLTVYKDWKVSAMKFLRKLKIDHPEIGDTIENFLEKNP